MTRRDWLTGLSALPASRGWAQAEFVCPMDPDIRAGKPGRCPRCGMTLVEGIPDQVEYPVSLRLRPAAPRPGERVQLAFTVTNPRTRSRVTEFELVHEKLWHLFVVGQDLSFFRHEHPRLDRDGVFRLDAVFPAPGLYRLLSDFYPRHGTPQLAESTVIVPGGPIATGLRLQTDLSVKQAANVEVSLATEPRQPIAGMRTRLFFDVSPGEGLEPYLGAWGHLLAVSEDLVDLIHNHPFLAEGRPRIQFNLIFPRPVGYRVWAQFQRQGVVNTARFDLAVAELK